MVVKEIQNKEIWEKFLLGCEEKTFLSSWNWGEFNRMMGNKVWRLGVFDGNKLVGLALVPKIMAKRGTFLLIQHGPVISQLNQTKEILQAFLKELKKIAKEENCSFIRMNPLWEPNQENQDILKSFGFREAPMHASAYEAAWKLDITPPEDELLRNMRKTTRYLIRRLSRKPEDERSSSPRRLSRKPEDERSSSPRRLSRKPEDERSSSPRRLSRKPEDERSSSPRQTLKNQDITVEKSKELDGLKIYQQLNEEVAKRQGFVPFSSEFIKNEFKVFSSSPDNQVLWFFGKYKGEVVAGALVVFWSGIGFYHQAASRAKYAKLSIPYLLSWEAIKEAKKRGCVLFDFWGYVDPKENPKHPWAGPTLFKMGFGGKAHLYLKTQDLPLSKKYWLTFIFEKLRKTKRGL
jgi:lipid II:glycine glycyltransferase (peptidoglycan interpeptide bridge formation enzyme)